MFSDFFILFFLTMKTMSAIGELEVSQINTHVHTHMQYLTIIILMLEILGD